MSTPINPYESPAAPISAIVGDELQQHGKFKSARVWGVVAILGLAINIALATASVVIVGQLFAAYSGIIVADYMDAEWVDVRLNHFSRMFIPMVVCRWLTAAAVITWMYQSHRNLIALGHRELDSKPIWVVLCWFVPLMNFFSPYHVMQEIWRRSDPDAIHTEPSDDTPLITSWWLTWIATFAAGMFANRLADQREKEWDHWDMIWWSGADALRSSTIIVAALLLIVIIVKLNRRQLDRIVALASQKQAAPSADP